MPQARGRVLTVVRTALHRRATSSDWYDGKKTLQGVREKVYELRYTHSCRVLLQPVRDELVIVDIGNHDVTTRYAALPPAQRAKLIEDRTPAPPGFTDTHPLFEEVDEGTYTSSDPVTGWSEFLSDDQAALADLIFEKTQYADSADKTVVIYLRGGAGTGKTAVLLNLALRLHDADIPVAFRCSTAVAKYLAAHTRVNVKRLQTPMTPYAAILLDDPRSPADVAAAVNGARLAQSPAVIVGFDPLQWPLKSLDTHLRAMPEPDIDEVLNDCYRQSATLARQATKVVTRIHERSSFRVDPVRIEAERRVLNELSNHYLSGLQFTRPGPTTYGPIARARAAVTTTYRRKGWRVERSATAGWDLTCRYGAQVLRVVTRPADDITIGRAEVAAANDPDWRLAVVDGPSLIEFDGAQALDYAETTTYRIPLP